MILLTMIPLTRRPAASAHPSAAILVPPVVLGLALALGLAQPAEAGSKKNRASRASSSAVQLDPQSSSSGPSAVGSGAASSPAGVLVDPSTLPAAGTSDGPALTTPQPGSGDSAAEYQRRKDQAAQGATSPQRIGNEPAIVLYFDEIDTSKDGQLSRSELEAFYATLRERIDAQFSAAFKEADLNGDGRLDIGELQAARPALVDMLGQVDANGDSYVTPDELSCRWGPK